MREIIITVLLAVIAGFGVKACIDDDNKPENIAAREAKRRAEVTPRLVSEADGCKVYAFNPDGERWRYFTRCANQTATDNNYSVQSGKTRRKVEDTITTENGK